jgi:hypothetical protein
VSPDQERETLPLAGDEKRAAVDYTAAQTVAAALLASVMGNTVADQGGDCGAAEIQRTPQDAPCWPDMNT